VQVQLHSLLGSVLDGGEWPASRPCCFSPHSKSGRHSIHSRSAPSVEEKAVLLVLGFDPRTVNSVASHYTD